MSFFFAQKYLLDIESDWPISINSLEEPCGGNRTMSTLSAAAGLGATWLSVCCPFVLCLYLID